MITYRKTKQGQWVAFGPATEITPGATVTVTKSNGTTKTERIASVGKPFTVNAMAMVYGYLAPGAPSTTASARPVRSGPMCDQCGERRATTTARDLSGFTGRVCGRCAAEGDLSFA